MKVLLLSVSIFLSNITTTLPNEDTDILFDNIKNKSIESLNLVNYHKVNLKELYKIKEYPVFSPLDLDSTNRISSPYGMRIHPIFRVKLFHSGVDITANMGDSVYSTAQGVVIESKYRRGYGKIVSIKHKSNYITRYAHLSKLLVNEGDTVDCSQLIGLIGSTGFSTGPHLHYEIRVNGKSIDPFEIHPYEINGKNFITYYNVINELKTYSDNV
jgi:murein DD-endopeptidase MepM/ murein hydrolase activator NlpD